MGGWGAQSMDQGPGSGGGEPGGCAGQAGTCGCHLTKLEAPPDALHGRLSKSNAVGIAYSCDLPQSPASGEMASSSWATSGGASAPGHFTSSAFHWLCDTSQGKFMQPCF